MNQQKSLIKISELLSRFKVQLGILNASSMLDINILAEDFFIPILNEVFDCNLINANSISKNFPAIDLIDNTNRITFQITSTSKSRKIRETLEKINKNRLYSDYDKFYILILTKKLAIYDLTMIATATEGKFIFTNDNVVDIEGLFDKIKSLPLSKIQTIEYYLESQYTDISRTDKIIGDNLKSILTKFENTYLTSKLEAACKARQEWYEKKSYLALNLVSIYDVNQKFSVRKSIEECDKNITSYESEICSIIAKIPNNE